MQLSHRSIPREYVHKLSEAQVLLSELHATGPDTFRMAARWPTAGFYGAVRGRHDPLIAIETARQTVPLLSHLAYGVPFGHRQSFTSLCFAIEPLAVPDPQSPSDVDLHVACREIVYRSGRLASMTLHIEFWHEGRRFGTAELAFRDHAPAVYRRLRGRYANIEYAAERAIPLLPPMSPDRVARDRFSDVVLSHTDSPHRSELRVDLSHPDLFDHPVDHVPGMLLLEAARQAAHSVVHSQAMTVVAMQATFSRYVELDVPCEVLADVLPSDDKGDRKVLVSAGQGGRPVFTCLTTLGPVTAS